MDGRMKPELILCEAEGSLRQLTGELELTAMDGDDRHGKEVLWDFDSVLDVDVTCAGGVLRRELPTTTPQLDPCEKVEHPGAVRLVALVPLFVLALQQHTDCVDPPGRKQYVRERVGRLFQQSRVAEAKRKIPCSLGVCRRLGIARHAAQRCKDHERVDPKRVVVELVGEYEGCAGVLE